jgi:hypothetical protein
LRDLVNAAALISLVGAAPRLKAPGRGDASTVHDVRRGKRGDQTEVFIKTGTGLIDWVLASVEAFSATVWRALTYWFCVLMQRRTRPRATS